MEIGLVQKVNIENEMQQAYLDYAMSVIVARALPDARDGLKPVHRRILYAMYDMGLRPDNGYKKSARIVGEVLGKYHPHGDMAVYEAMARMAQDFSMRYQLVDGQGNFGSVDGDPPAAMRYTEARLASPAMEILSDIQKDTVDFNENFDGTLTEPTVLPSAIPNLLVNGATGIAVGMSTSIPPHNMDEVIDALRFMLDRWEKMDDISLEDLMSIIEGPDFPTGGIIIQDPSGDGLHSAYSTGRGRVTIQAHSRIEEMERGRNRIIITELPYQTNKSALIERIASLVRDERLEGIADLRDESDRQGMRIVIDLAKSAEPRKVLADLYKSTPMQSTFSIIMLALVNGEPRLLGLKQLLRVYLEHRLEIVRRRSEHDLLRARQRAHILEGLMVALKNLDEVISIIRRSPDADTARIRLIKRFKLTEIQAQAILDMQLRRLASLERKKIEDEYKDLLAQIKFLESLLRSSKKMREVVSTELLAVKETHGDRRRTHIVHLGEGKTVVDVMTAVDLTPEKLVWVSMTADGIIGRSMDDSFSRTSSKDIPRFLLQASTRDTLYLADSQGEAAAISLLAIPEVAKPGEGIPFNKVTPLPENDPPAALFVLPAKAKQGEEWGVITCTRLGMVKKTLANELPGPSANLFTLVRVNDGDRLIAVRTSKAIGEIFLLASSGMAIRFNEAEVRPMGLVAAGVTGIKLQPHEEVVGMELLPQAGEVFILASDGTAKRVSVEQFPKQGRYGQGVVGWKLPPKVTAVGLTIGQGTIRATLHMKKLAPKTIRLDEAPLVSRAARGKTIQEVKPGDQIIALTIPWGYEQKDLPDHPKGSTPVKKPATRTSPKTKPSGSNGGTTPRSGASLKGTPSGRSKVSEKPDSRVKKEKTSQTGTRTQTTRAAAPQAKQKKSIPGQKTTGASKTKPAGPPAKTKTSTKKSTAAGRTGPTPKPQSRTTGNKNASKVTPAAKKPVSRSTSKPSPTKTGTTPTPKSRKPRNTKNTG